MNKVGKRTDLKICNSTHLTNGGYILTNWLKKLAQISKVRRLKRTKAYELLEWKISKWSGNAMKCYPHARDIYTIIFAGWFNKANCKCDIGIKKNLIKISKNTEFYYQPFLFQSTSASNRTCANLAGVQNCSRRLTSVIDRCKIRCPAWRLRNRDRSRLITGSSMFIPPRETFWLVDPAC